MPFAVSLAMGRPENALLMAVSFSIMILLSFAGSLFYNTCIMPEHFMNSISEESPSVIFNAAKDQKEKLLTMLDHDDRFQQASEYVSMPVSYRDGNLTALICQDFTLTTNYICYQGRIPETACEIAVGNALANQYPIDLSILISVGDKQAAIPSQGLFKA